MGRLRARLRRRSPARPGVLLRGPRSRYADQGFLAAVGPGVVVVVFFWLTRERPLGPWAPWWGCAAGGGGRGPWYLAMEAHSPGFLTYTLIDSYVSGLTRQRALPDENVPLGSLEFLVVTFLAFLPWALALPWAPRARLPAPLGKRARAALARVRAVVGGRPRVLRAVAVQAALPCAPGVSGLRPDGRAAWDEAIDHAPGALSARTLMVPVLGLFALVTTGFAAAAAGLRPFPSMRCRASTSPRGT